MKTWQIIFSIFIIIVILACAISTTMDIQPNGPQVESAVYNETGVGNGSFIFKSTYISVGRELSDSFVVTVKTDGHWSANYDNNIITVVNEDNKPIKHITISKDGKQYGVDANANEEEKRNTVGLFKINYSKNLATITVPK